MRFDGEGDPRLEDDREREPCCPRHCGEPAGECSICDDVCDVCGGTQLVTVEVAAYSLSWLCHCAHENRRPEPIAAE
jgi:hypothetical protein